jgi:hypothetical protein
MGRPAGYQWQPLGLDYDPVPGDPAQISQEAQHLASVAAQITEQVAVLRKIGGDNTEVGQHAETIRSHATETAGQLAKLVGRYQKVSSILNGWVPELQQAQSMSIQALNEAEGPYQKLNQCVVLPSGDKLTPQQQQQVRNYHNAMNQAQGELDAAKALLARAVALRDSAAGNTANAINNASNDGMRDHHSLWGSIAGFFSSMFSFVVGNWAQILADLCTVLEIVATALAIFAFIIVQFLPGVDILVDMVAAMMLASFLATAMAAVGRGVLAGTGHGSWLDFGLDMFALATFGLGRGLGLIAGRMLVPGAEAASRLALTSELITDFSTDGPRAAYLIKFASMEGIDAVEAANRLGKLAPDLANGSKLSGFLNVMDNLGGFGKEGEAYAKLISLGDRFTTPIADLSDYSALAKVMSSATGISAGISGVAGATSAVWNGIELDWGSWKGTLEVPSWHKFYYNHFEVRTGAPAGG